MPNSIYHAFEWFFGLKIISDYLFPVASGIYLTFFTASIIRFLDLKRSAERALEAAYRSIELAPAAQSLDAWRLVIKSAFTPLFGVASELRDEGHQAAARLVEEVAQKITSETITAVDHSPRTWSLRAVGLFARGEAERAERESLERQGKLFQSTTLSFLVSRTIQSKSAIDRARGSKLVFFQVKALRSVLKAMEAEQQKLAIRSAEPCCHCGKCPHKVV